MVHLDTYTILYEYIYILSIMPQATDQPLAGYLNNGVLSIIVAKTVGNTKHNVIVVKGWVSRRYTGLIGLGYKADTVDASKSVSGNRNRDVLSDRDVVAAESSRVI